MNKQCDCKETDCPLCLLEAANARLLRVARAAKVVVGQIELARPKDGRLGNSPIVEGPLKEALKEVEDLL